MPTPAGHSLVGLLLYYSKTRDKVEFKEALFYIFFANAADLDFLAGFLFNDPNRYHHGISHSFAAGLLLGLCVTFFFYLLKRDDSFWRGGLVVVIYSTHIVLDFFSLDESLPYGVPCLWPLTGEYFISPLSLFTDVKRGDSNAGFLGGIFYLHNWYAVFMEVTVIGFFYIFVKRLRLYFIKQY